ncbi:hypothetical protein ABT010_13670 [Streptomyces sp. NPDC002668]|uniref:hypothetical protein n=1 Tax=Streptomyces sp. NPDC002668 TaxID=3154422 RepID=UPI00332EB1C4
MLSLTFAVYATVAMRVAGRADWWAPGPPRRLHSRVGLREAPASDAVLRREYA